MGQPLEKSVAPTSLAEFREKRIGEEWVKPQPSSKFFRIRWYNMRTGERGQTCRIRGDVASRWLLSERARLPHLEMFLVPDGE